MTNKKSQKWLEGDMDNIFTSWSVGVALMLASLFFSAGYLVEKTNHISSELVVVVVVVSTFFFSPFMSFSLDLFGNSKPVPTLALVPRLSDSI